MGNLKVCFLMGITFLSAALQATEPGNTIVRAAIDIGMGGPKLQIAEVDPKTDKIVQMLHSERYFVNFHESLSQNPHHQLNSDIRAEGIKAFKEAIAKAHAFHVDGIVAIATAALRSAANGEEFAKELGEETGVTVHIIDQELEGKLAFQAVLSKMQTCAENLVVWDIGGGSIQFVMADKEGSHRVDCGNEGAGAFVNFILKNIQHRNRKNFQSPNPMSSEEILLAENHARTLSLKVSDALRNKINAPETTVVGAGSVFGWGISAFMQGKNPFLVDDLADVVSSFSGKTDTDFGGGDYAFCEGTNAILALGLMRGLNIRQLHIININNADGALVYKDFW